MTKILIAGGTGFVGEHLHGLLMNEGHEVFVLSTQVDLSHLPHILHWSPYKKEIDLKGHDDFDTIINLSGANIASKYWTEKRMSELIKSRVETTTFLKSLVNSDKLKSNYFLQASAIGYYGDREDELLTEESSKGSGFLADLTDKWEKSIMGLNTPHSIIRIGLVFHPDNGSLPKFIAPLKFNLNPIMGRGNQYLSWIEVSDLCRLMKFLCDNKMTGIYNGVSSNPIQLCSMMKESSDILEKRPISIHIPSVLIEVLLRKFSELFLFSQKVSNSKICEKGFRFVYDEFKEIKIV